MLWGIPFRSVCLRKELANTSEFSSSDDHDDDVFYVCGSQSSYAFFSFRKAYPYLQKGLNFCLSKAKRENFCPFVKGA